MPSQITVMARFFGETGSPASVELLTPITAQSFFPVLALARNGRGAVAWFQVDPVNQTSDRRGRALDSPQKTWGPSFLWLDAGSGLDGVDSAAAWPDTSVALSSHQTLQLGEPSIAAVQRFDSTGLPLTPVIREGVGGGFQSSEVAALPGGRFVHAWSSPDGYASGEGVRARVFTPEGVPE